MPLQPRGWSPHPSLNQSSMMLLLAFHAVLFSFGQGSHCDCLLRPAECQVLSHKQTHTAPPDPHLAPYEVVLSCLPTAPPQTALFTSAEDQGLVKDQTARKGWSSLTCQSAFFSPTLNLLLTAERMPRLRLSALTLNIQNPEEGLRGSSEK